MHINVCWMSSLQPPILPQPQIHFLPFPILPGAQPTWDVSTGLFQPLACLPNWEPQQETGGREEGEIRVFPSAPFLQACFGPTVSLNRSVLLSRRPTPHDSLSFLILGTSASLCPISLGWQQLHCCSPWVPGPSLVASLDPATSL